MSQPSEPRQLHASMTYGELPRRMPGWRGRVAQWLRSCADVLSPSNGLVIEVHTRCGTDAVEYLPRAQVKRLVRQSAPLILRSVIHDRQLERLDQRFQYDPSWLVVGASTRHEP